MWRLLTYKIGQKFKLKHDVTVMYDTFEKDSTVEIAFIVEESIFPYNLWFVEKGIFHMAFSRDFIESNCY